MKTYVQTADELIEVIGGSLICRNTKPNWDTISEWLMAQDSGFEATIRIYVDMIRVDFPKTTPTHMMGSLLEHFEYQ